MPSTLAKQNVLGYEVVDVPLEELVELAQGWVSGTTAHQIVTLNPEMVVLAETDSAFQAVLRQADVLLCDGVGLQWAAGVSGFWQGIWRGVSGFLSAGVLQQPIRHRIAGVDLTERLLATGADNGWRVALIGAEPGVAEAAAQVWQARYTKLNVVMAEEGLAPGADQAAAETLSLRIGQTKADLLLVAFGAPKQDRFIAENKTRLGAPLMIGVGGTFDFVSGKQKRAPERMRRGGLEWLYRLFREPKRWRRQRRLLSFIWRVLRHERSGSAA